MSETKKCSKLISEQTTMRVRRCSRNAKVEFLGKSYCHQHDPEIVQRRLAESLAHFRVQQSKENQRRLELAIQARLLRVEPVINDGRLSISLEDAKRLARDCAYDMWIVEGESHTT